MINSSLPIVIIGAGPAGSSCAIQLIKHGFDVILIEKTESFPKQPPQTCSAKVMSKIDSLVAVPLPQSAYLPLSFFYSSWGSEALSARDLLFWDIQTSFILDRQVFDNHMLKTAEHTGANLLSGAHVIAATWQSSNWELELLCNGRHISLKAGFIVEATGKVFSTAVWPDVQRYFTDKLVCVSAKCDIASEEITMVEAFAGGWYYTAPHPQGGQTIGLFTDADLLPPKPKLNSWMNDVLKKTFQLKQYVTINDKSPFISWDARTSVRSLIWRDCWLAIGDAAWSLDPLSGSGLQRAVTDGVNSANAIAMSTISETLQPLKQHALARAHDFRKSLGVQKRYYNMEERWSSEVFWARRR